ncbi:hypothetical protein J1605_020790 [Eschrichtius robustus]|uniref:Uncharacterized protein n=1 Tax=Eschrichtius robustus TaxID=9764 RepID=A0AB34HJM5_ESCRO|nr:hypothetical protein J1605_020790 [Eschrichtius robustus]
MSLGEGGGGEKRRQAVGAPGRPGGLQSLSVSGGVGGGQRHRARGGVPGCGVTDIIPGRSPIRHRASRTALRLRVTGIQNCECTELGTESPCVGPGATEAPAACTGPARREGGGAPQLVTIRTFTRRLHGAPSRGVSSSGTEKRASPELRRREQKHVAGSRAKIQGGDRLPLAHPSRGGAARLSPRIPSASAASLPAPARRTHREGKSPRLLRGDKSRALLTPPRPERSTWRPSATG